MRVRYAAFDIPGESGCRFVPGLCRSEQDEETLWAYFDFTYRLRKKDTLSLRYDVIRWLDDTATEEPRPDSVRDAGLEPGVLGCCQPFREHLSAIDTGSDLGYHTAQELRRRDLVVALVADVLDLSDSESK